MGNGGIRAQSPAQLPDAVLANDRIIFTFLQFSSYLYPICKFPRDTKSAANFVY